MEIFPFLLLVIFLLLCLHDTQDSRMEEQLQEQWRCSRADWPGRNKKKTINMSEEFGHLQ